MPEAHLCPPGLIGLIHGLARSDSGVETLRESERAVVLDRSGGPRHSSGRYAESVLISRCKAGVQHDAVQQAPGGGSDRLCEGSGADIGGSTSVILKYQLTVLPAVSREMQDIRFFVKNCPDDVVNAHGVPGRELKATGARDLLEQPGLAIDPDLGIPQWVSEEAEHPDGRGLPADPGEKICCLPVSGMISRGDGQEQANTVFDDPSLQAENHLWPKRFGCPKYRNLLRLIPNLDQHSLGAGPIEVKVLH